MNADTVASRFLPVYMAQPSRLPFYRDWSCPTLDETGTFMRGLALPFTDPNRDISGQITFDESESEGKLLGYAPIDGKLTEMTPFFRIKEPNFTNVLDWQPLPLLIWIDKLGYGFTEGPAFVLEGRTIRVPFAWDTHEMMAEILRVICYDLAVKRRLVGHLAPEILAAILSQEFCLDTSLLRPPKPLREELRGLTAEKLIHDALLAFEMACNLLIEVFGEKEAARMIPRAPSPKPERPNLMEILFQEVSVCC